MVAVGMRGWIFSYQACRVRALGSRSFRAGRLRGSEQSVQIARSIRPAERPQSWPEMSHFGAEFFRILRGSGGRLCSISKVLVFRA
jgi:hypothetical protein